VIQRKRERQGADYVEAADHEQHPGERLAAFSRAVRVDNLVFVSGTTAIDSRGAIQHPGDAAAQTAYVLRKIEVALGEAGASLADVVRTRIVVRDTEHSDAVACAHAKTGSGVTPEYAPPSRER
jgi:enamine deaminase RidA (YjgF/YER057c/UK114 family)